jgi:hypothetical protein
MARPEPPQTAPVSTGLADEDPIAERLVQEEIGGQPRGLDDLEAEGLHVEEESQATFAVEDGLAAADAAAADLPISAPAAAAEEPPSVDVVLEEERARSRDPERGIPPGELKRLEDWDDQTADEQENLPDDEQQG